VLADHREAFPRSERVRILKSPGNGLSEIDEIRELEERGGLVVPGHEVTQGFLEKDVLHAVSFEWEWRDTKRRFR
jgi:hypothetical protein